MDNFSQRIVSIGVITSLTMGDDQIDTHTTLTLQGFSGGPLVKYVRSNKHGRKRSYTEKYDRNTITCITAKYGRIRSA